jgi:hypothetical protein
MSLPVICCKRESLVLKRTSLISYVNGNICSYVYVLSNTLAKFHETLHNSENWDAGEEAERVMKASWLKRILENHIILQFSQFRLQIYMIILDVNGWWVFKHVSISWLQNSLNVIIKFSAKESIISKELTLWKGTLHESSLWRKSFEEKLHRFWRH